MPVLTVSLIELPEGGDGKHLAFRASAPSNSSPRVFFSPSLPLFAPATQANEYADTTSEKK